MSSTTLISLAILKVQIDHGSDYLDHLQPFIIQVLADHRPDPVTPSFIRGSIRDQFGLEIPQPTITLVLNRITRRLPLRKSHGVFRITGDIPDPGLVSKQTESRRHIDAVLEDLRAFSRTTAKPLPTDDDAVTAICTFLNRFSIPCLRSYLRDTVLPTPKKRTNADIVLVADFVQHLRRTSPERFESFLVMLQGHMLANALTRPDLSTAQSHYGKVTFYFDTPLLVQFLGAEGDAKRDAASDLLRLLTRLRGRTAAFSHSLDELRTVLEGAAEHLNSPGGRGAIVLEARRRKTTKSDLLLLCGLAEDRLAEAGIEVVPTPPHIDRFQIDEEVFEQVLEDGISYWNPRAKQYDITSVRSIFTIRGDKSAPFLERARAVLVTSNIAFAKAAWEYGQRYEGFRDVSSVITDFSLANMAWLKVPMGAVGVPTTQLLAYSYAALQPSRQLLDRYMNEIDKLETAGDVPERSLQLLRSSTKVYDELTRLTLGDDSTVTESTLSEIHDRIEKEIKKEETAKLTAERQAHWQTQESLQAHQARERQRIENIYWRCADRARFLARTFWYLLGSLCVLGTIGSLGLGSTNRLVTWLLTASCLLLPVLALANLLTGTTVAKCSHWIETRCRRRLLAREARRSDIDVRQFDSA